MLEVTDIEMSRFFEKKKRHCPSQAPTKKLSLCSP